MNNVTDAQDLIRQLEYENDSLLKRAVELGVRVNTLQDEVTRLRASMPAQVLREYDRRHWGGS